METTTLELKNVKKLYKDVLGVGPVSFKVSQGEFIALLGPSGCGKTTTLRCVAGLETPTEGEILMDGMRINERPVHKREIGFVFQDYALFPHMTVEQNVGFGLRFRGEKRDKSQTRSRVLDALALVGLHGLEKRYPSQLSGGQQQRVALARALVIQPKILLLDEPLSNIDAALRQRMQVELKTLQQKVGITAIHVTHDQQEAFTLADRVALFNKGQLVQMGAPDEVYEFPADSFAAEFIGETNFIPGMLVRSDGGFSLRIGETMVLALDPRMQIESGLVGQQVMAAIRPQRVRLQGVDELKGSNVFVGEIERKLNMGDVFRFVILVPTGSTLQGKEAGGLRIVVNKYNTSASRGLPSQGSIQFQLDPADIRSVKAQVV
jgi:ABC-type Fe3+/spermidine/putrescine transport system ATPase subunit